MPHECTNCGRTFADGSKEMLSGCPDCGGNKFQFDPAGGSDGGTEAGDASAAAAPDDTPADDTAGSTGTVGRARERVRDWVGSEDGSTADAAPTDAPRSDAVSADAATADAGTTPAGTTDAGPTDASTADAGAGTPVDEDAAQADARSGVVASDELPDDPPDAALDEPSEPTETTSDRAPPDRGSIADTPDDERPDLSQLREELNQQFESIKIVQPGRYELNLMELYDRDEYIISLQEDGRYVIEVPETWRSGDDA